MFAVVDGKQSAPYAVILGNSYYGMSGVCPVFSADSQHVAFTGIARNRGFVILDGEESSPYDDTGLPVFSPDGQHLAFSAKAGDHWLVVVDGQEGAAYAYIGPTIDYVASPIFSSDSQRVAYSASVDDAWVIV